MPIALTHFAGRAGDHNDRAMAASPLLTAALEERFASAAVVIDRPSPALATGWAEELRHATPALLATAERYRDLLGRGATPVTALSRCAVALATLPVVASHHPDAVVVWFDAHADLNTPETTGTGYLGGLALSGPLGLWDSGLGDGLAPANTVLVGTRDLDPAEQALVDDGTIALVPCGPGAPEALRRAVAGRPVYVHLDCDVLEPDSVPTDYRVPGGMSLPELEACARALSAGTVVGLEIGELETDDADPDSDGPARSLLAALEPLLRAVEAAGAPVVAEVTPTRGRGSETIGPPSTLER